MSHVRLTILVVCLVVPASLRAADGEVDVYLQPLPPEAARLTFAILSVTAVGVNGSEYPLKLNIRAVGQAEAARQRLLASSRLPSGSYVGFALTVKQAALKSEHAEAALTVPDGPVRIDVPFVVAQHQSPLIWLKLKYDESVSGGMEFRPAFLAVTPPRPIADHAGFVSNSRSNTISVFDKSIAQAVAVIDTCAGPAGLALDQHRRRLYVACPGDDEIQSIDVATGEVIERARSSPGDRPTELALTPDGVTLLSVNTGSNSVSFFDALSLARQERVNVGSGPRSITLDSAGRRAFVFNTLSSSLSVIDVGTHTTAATMSTEASPLRGQFNRRGDRLYVIHDRSPYMTVVDPRQLTVPTRARLRTGVTAIAIDMVRDLVCIGGGNDTTIEFYEPNTLMPLYSMRARSGVSYMAIDAEDSALYMVDPDARSLLIAHLNDRKMVTEIDVGDRPYSVAVMGEK